MIAGDSAVGLLTSESALALIKLSQVAAVDVVVICWLDEPVAIGHQLLLKVGLQIESGVIGLVKKEFV